jgi:hypothetical protein
LLHAQFACLLVLCVFAIVKEYRCTNYWCVVGFV